AGVDIVGEVQTARASAEETLLDVANRYAVGYEQVRMVNPEVDTWLPGVGTAVRIPSRYILPDAPREGVVINLAEMRLYHYPEDEAVVEVFPVSIGRRDWSTPPGKTRVTAKIEEPTWFPPASIREEAAERGEPLPERVPPGPDNPLGHYALPLEISGYLIHGTNRPWGIGMRSTHGCIRLHPHDIAYLFDEVEVGTQVVIVDQPFKAGWGEDGLLYLQAFPSFGGEALPRRERLAAAAEAVSAALGGVTHRVDGSNLRTAVERQDGQIRRLSRPGVDPVEVARRAE
ncbi:MAG: L,D-transpeptidase family protein, partial [Halorhodospira sp.]